MDEERRDGDVTREDGSWVPDDDIDTLTTYDEHSHI